MPSEDGSGAPPAMSREMFRLWSLQQPGRFERVDGLPVRMSAERTAHARVKARVWQALERAVAQAGVPCEALPDGMTVEVGEHTDYEPDAVVNCGPRNDPEAVTVASPLVVVEVLSRSTRSVDTGGKLADYFLVPSIQHYLIVQTRRRSVVHHRRAGAGIETRLLSDGVVTLDPPGIAVAIAEFYAGS